MAQSCKAEKFMEFQGAEAVELGSVNLFLSLANWGTLSTAVKTTCYYVQVFLMAMLFILSFRGF